MKAQRETSRIPAILFGLAFGTAVGFAGLPSTPSPIVSETAEVGDRAREPESAVIFSNPDHLLTPLSVQTSTAALENTSNQKRETYEKMGKGIFDDANLFREYISDLVSWGEVRLAELRADEYDSIHRDPASQDLGMGVLTLVDALRDSGRSVDAEALLEGRIAGT